MDLTQAATLGGATVLVGIIVQAIKRLLAWPKAKSQRYGALGALLIGIVVVLLLSVAQGKVTGTDTAQAIAAAVITGILAGAAAAGLYDNAATLTAK